MNLSQTCEWESLSSNFYTDCSKLRYLKSRKSAIFYSFCRRLHGALCTIFCEIRALHYVIYTVLRRVLGSIAGCPKGQPPQTSIEDERDPSTSSRSPHFRSYSRKRHRSWSLLPRSPSRNSHRGGGPKCAGSGQPARYNLCNYHKLLMTMDKSFCRRR